MAPVSRLRPRVLCQGLVVWLFLLVTSAVAMAAVPAAPVVDQIPDQIGEPEPDSASFRGLGLRQCVGYAHDHLEQG